MKPRIFIAAHYLEIGGAEISLIGLLQAIDYTRFDVDLFLYAHKGELMKFIPKEVNLLPQVPAYTKIENPLKETLLSSHFKIGLARLMTKWQYRKLARIHKWPDNHAYYQILANNVTPHLPSLKKYGEYDLAINFIGMMNVVRDKIQARKKVTCIHTDYSAVGVYPEIEQPIWEGFDKIISISSAVSKSFLKVFPTLENKIVEIENILSSNFVRQRANLEISDGMFAEKGTKKILSIGRFCTAKNYDNVPDICRRVIALGCNIKWFIIGYGGDESLIRRKIVESGMQSHVILLGKKENPYPYIKACDFYVQPSRYEGKSVTVREAQMLCKPVLITNYSTAQSQVNHTVDGIIAPMDNAGCAAALADLINNESLQGRLIEYLHTHDYGNTCGIEKFYKLAKMEM